MNRYEFIKKIYSKRYIDKIVNKVKLLGIDDKTDPYSFLICRLLTSIFDKIPDELLQTVYNYIKCNQSIAKTSDLMFTHRNTINYRINKFINMVY